MRNARFIVLFAVGIFMLLAAEMLLSLEAFRNADMRDTLLPYPDVLDELIIEHSDGALLALRKASDWRMVSPYASAVDVQKVSRLIDCLALTPIQDSISESEMAKLGRRYDDFSLENPVAVVRLVGGCVTNVVSFGSVTPDGRGVYALVNGGRTVFCMPVELLREADASPDAFRLQTVFASRVESVIGIDFKNGIDKTVTFSKGTSGWTFMGKSVSDVRVSEFLMKLCNAKVKEFVWPVGRTNEFVKGSSSLLAGYGLDSEDVVSVSLRGISGDMHRIVIGKGADELSVYALIHDGEAIVMLPVEFKDMVVGVMNGLSDVRMFSADKNAVSMVAISEGETACILTKSGDEWRMDAPITAIADKDVVGKLLDRLLSLPSVVSYGEQVLVSLSTNSAPVKVPASVVWDGISIESFRSKELLRVDPFSIRRLVRTTTSGAVTVQSVVFDRDRKSWNVESGGKSAANHNLTGIASALELLRAERVVKLKVSANKYDDYGLDVPFLTLSVDLHGDDTVRKNILIGAEAAGGRYVTIGASDAIFLVSDDVLAPLLKPLVEQ